MDTILIKGEPLGAVIARLATNECQSPRELMRNLMPGTPAATFGFTLPLHLGVLASHLPAQLGATPEMLAENFTFFPAIAPILEDGERVALMKAMIAGRRLPGLPITFCRKSRDLQNTIRFCPICAAQDRLEGWGATWRMVHNLFGVTACPFHGRRLVCSGRGFNEDLVVVEADRLIPSPLPCSEPASEEETMLAQDLEFAFESKHLRPGRAKLAAALHGAFGDAGMMALTQTAKGGRRVMELVQQHFAESFRQIYDAGGNVRPDSWEICYAARPRIYPLVKIAMLARIAGTGLPGLLERASGLDPEVTALGFCAVPIPSLSGRANRKHRQARPRRSRPQNPRRLLKWAARDARLEDVVRNQARAWRADKRRERITPCGLAAAAKATNWRRPELWAEKLPRFHAALRDEFETVRSHTVRILERFLDGEPGRRQRNFLSERSLLLAAGLRSSAHLVEVMEVAASALEAQRNGEAPAVWALRVDERRRRAA